VPADPEDSSLDFILNSKKILIQDQLGMLMIALYERKTIQEAVTNQIEYDLTRCQNYIFKLENVSYFSMQQEWERKKFDLSKELRMEQTSCFRDIQMIQKELRDTMLEYIKEKQTEALFQ
jgi:hypothetical protein